MTELGTRAASLNLVQLVDLTQIRLVDDDCAIFCADSNGGGMTVSAGQLGHGNTAEYRQARIVDTLRTHRVRAVACGLDFTVVVNGVCTCARA